MTTDIVSQSSHLPMKVEDLATADWIAGLLCKGNPPHTPIDSAPNFIQKRFKNIIVSVSGLRK
jgi:hypothetical protein